MPFPRHDVENCTIPDCFGCKAATLHIGAGALPNRRRETKLQTDYDRQIARDHRAYRELQRQGIQPATPVGCATAALQAESRFEIESGQILPKGEGKRADRISAEMKHG